MALDDPYSQFLKYGSYAVAAISTRNHQPRNNDRFFSLSTPPTNAVGMERALRASMHDMAEQLKNERTTTSCTVSGISADQVLTTAHVGNSVALLFTLDHHGRCTVTPITSPHPQYSVRHAGTVLDLHQHQLPPIEPGVRRFLCVASKGLMQNNPLEALAAVISDGGQKGYDAFGMAEQLLQLAQRRTKDNITLSLAELPPFSDRSHNLILGACDGKGGHLAAEHVATHLPASLLHHLSFRDAHEAQAAANAADQTLLASITKTRQQLPIAWQMVYPFGLDKGPRLGFSFSVANDFDHNAMRWGLGQLGLELRHQGDLYYVHGDQHVLRKFLVNQAGMLRERLS